MPKFPRFISSILNKSFLKKTTLTGTQENLNFDYIVKYSGNIRISDPLPMLVALHGDGDTASDFYESALDKFTLPVRIILIKGPISHEYGAVWPFSVSQFKKYGEAFSKAIEQLSIKFPTINKPILLGFSGGGTMAYYQAVKHGNCYSYIFPVSGLLSNEQLGKSSSKPDSQVFAYHGKSDDVVPFSAGEKAVNILKNKKVNVSFTEFEGGHLALFSEMKYQITQAIEEKLRTL